MKKKAFTLVELLIVIAVIAILFIVLLSKVNFASDRAKDSGVLTDFRSYQIGVQQTIRETGMIESEDAAAFSVKLNKNLDKKMRFVASGSEFQSETYNPYGYHYVLTKDGSEIKIYSINNQGDSEILNAEYTEVYAAEEYSVGKVIVFNATGDTLDIDVERFADNSSVDYQEKSGETGEVTPPPVVHTSPSAIITLTPNTEITTDTTLTWSYANSTCESGATIVAYEWQNALDKYAAGNHTIRLRVKDSNGLWSDWAEKNITVTQAITWGMTDVSELLSWNYNNNLGRQVTTHAPSDDYCLSIVGTYHYNYKSIPNIGTDSTMTLKARLSATVNENANGGTSSDCLVWITTSSRTVIGFNIGRDAVEIYNGRYIKEIAMDESQIHDYKITLNKGIVNMYIDEINVYNGAMAINNNGAMASTVMVGDNNYGAKTSYIYYYDVNYSTTNAVD